MKFSTVFAVFATLATAVSATLSSGLDFNTNAKRLAYGLPPLSPHRRGHKHGGTPTYGGKKGHPSGIHGSCNGGTMHCCNSVTHSNPEVNSMVKDILGVVVGPGVGVGLTCSPLTALGLSSGSCTQQKVCCEGNHFKGAVVVGCSPINVNLV